MNVELPEELILDYSLWRCGGNKYREGNGHGEGHTSLCNVQGYMCCLGEFINQAEVGTSSLMHYSSPAGFVNSAITMATDISGLTECRAGYITRDNTSMTDYLMEVNDNPTTSISSKVIAIRDKLEENGYTLELKNFPEDILEEINAKTPNV